MPELELQSLESAKQLLSKTIDRLYQERRESGLTRYAVLAVLVGSIFYITENYESIELIGFISVAYLQLGFSLGLLLFSATFDAHIDIKESGNNFYSKLSIDRINITLKGAFYVSLIIVIISLLLLQNNINNYHGNQAESIIGVLSLINFSIFGFLAFAIRRIRRKYIGSLTRKLGLSEIFRVDTILRDKTTDILRLRFYTALSGISSLVIFYLYIDLEIIVFEITIVKIVLPYVLAIIGGIGAFFQFISAQKLSIQISSLQKIESQVILNNNLTLEEKYGMSTKLIYVPTLKDWITYHSEQFLARMMKLDSSRKRLEIFPTFISKFIYDIKIKQIKSADYRLMEMSKIEWISKTHYDQLVNLHQTVERFLLKLKSQEEE